MGLPDEVKAAQQVCVCDCNECLVQAGQIRCLVLLLHDRASKEAAFLALVCMGRDIIHVLRKSCFLASIDLVAMTDLCTQMVSQTVSTLLTTSTVS